MGDWSNILYLLQDGSIYIFCCGFTRLLDAPDSCWGLIHLLLDEVAWRRGFGPRFRQIRSPTIWVLKMHNIEEKNDDGGCFLPVSEPDIVAECFQWVLHQSFPPPAAQTMLSLHSKWAFKFVGPSSQCQGFDLCLCVVYVFIRSDATRSAKSCGILECG